MTVTSGPPRSESRSRGGHTNPFSQTGAHQIASGSGILELVTWGPGGRFGNFCGRDVLTLRWARQWRGMGEMLCSCAWGPRGQEESGSLRQLLHRQPGSRGSRVAPNQVPSHSADPAQAPLCRPQMARNSPAFPVDGGLVGASHTVRIVAPNL